MRVAGRSTGRGSGETQPGRNAYSKEERDHGARHGQPQRYPQKTCCVIIEIGIALLSNFRKIMLNGKRIAVVLPAYNAEKTLEATVRELPEMVDVRILVDDHSKDATV